MVFARVLHRWIRYWVEKLLETGCRGCMGKLDLKSTVFSPALAMRLILITERVDLKVT
jgi:hypothetical protein